MAEIDEIRAEILDKINIPVLVVSQKLEPFYCNNAFLKLCDQSADSELRVSEVLPELSTSQLKSDLFTTTLYTDQARSLDLNVRVDQLGLELFLLTFRDVSINKESLHSQRMETLGILSGGVAHDFNNILAGIIGHVAYLDNILPETGEHIDSLAAIEEGGKKATQMTQEILRFSKFDSSNGASQVELNSIIERTLNLLKGALSPKTELQFNRYNQPVAVFGSELKISQILINLVVNSHDALMEIEKKDCPIEIDLSVCSDTTKLVDIFGSDALLSEYAEITVIDSGCGMSKDTLQRAFQPYFSTKDEQGTGLGLATVAAIVKSIGGAVDIETKVNLGTRVSIFLPLVLQLDEEKQASDKIQLDFDPSSKNILIIDDEEIVRNVLTLNLKQLNFKVESVESGIKALELLKTGKKFDLIILDMLMPVLSGEETFYQIRKLIPEQKCLLVSGYCSEDVVNKLLDDGAKGFLSKPFGIDELSNQVHESINND